MTRLGRAVLVALLVLLMAATPLSAILSPPAVFETWLPGWGEGYGAAPTIRVVLRDETGLVRTIAPAAARDPHLDSVTDPRVLVVEWLGGCGDLTTHLTFRRVGEGYELDEHTDAFGCALLVGYQRSVALFLWRGLDPELVSVRLGR